jgi:hypothetical protein
MIFPLINDHEDILYLCEERREEMKRVDLD